MNVQDAVRTSNFKDFLHTSSHFAKLAFGTEFQALPHLVKQSKEIIVAVGQEMRRFPEICSDFTTIVQSFVKLATDTHHNMSISRSHLSKVLVLMQMRVAEAIQSPQALSANDTSVIRWGFLNMSNGAKKMLIEASGRYMQSEQLQERIEKLKVFIQSLIKSAEERIEFSKRVLNIVAVLGGTLLAVAVVLGGLSIAPFDAMTATKVIDTLALGFLLTLIIILWHDNLFKAQSKLKLILDDLNKLSLAYMSFNGNMFKYKESIRILLSYVNDLGKSIQVNLNHKRKSICAQRCAHAINSTKCLIGLIDHLAEIDLTRLAKLKRP